MAKKTSPQKASQKSPTKLSQKLSKLKKLFSEKFKSVKKFTLAKASKFYSKAAEMRRKKPRRFYAIVAVAVLALLWFSGSSPQPEASSAIRLEVSGPTVARVSAGAEFVVEERDTRIALPQPGRNRRIDNFPSLNVSFRSPGGGRSPSVAAPEFIGRDISEKVQITPAIKGTWHFHGASTISFTPEHDWPAGREFNVRLNPALFSEEIDRKTFRFETPRFAGNLELFATFPNPAQKRTLIAVAQVDFSHQIDTDDFERRVSLNLGNRSVGFSVKYDNLRRQAFIYSNPIQITDATQTLRIAIDGARTIQGERPAENVRGNLTIASADEFFKITSARTVIVRNNQDVQEQVLMVEFSDAAINPLQNIELYRLPEFTVREGSRETRWTVEAVDDDVIARSERIDLRPVSTDDRGGTFGFVFSAEEQNRRPLFLRILPGIKSENDFEIRTEFSSIVSVPMPERTVNIVGSGSILPLGGSRELAFVTQGGINEITVELSRINAAEVNHLVTQTHDTIGSARFNSWSFNEDNISVLFRRNIRINNQGLGASYSSINLGEHITSNSRGIFVVDVYPSNSSKGARGSDRRLIVLSDIGLIRKVAEDRTSSLFAVSLSSGRPVGYANVSVLGRNGIAIYTTRTRSNGRADLPAFPHQDYRAGREPVVITITSGNDMSFIPFEAHNMQVDYSRFNIGGVHVNSRQNLDAYLFSDRGIYRPGEDMIIAGMVKNRAAGSLAGIPLLLRVTNSQGATVTERRFTLDAAAAFDHAFPIPSASPTGTYRANLYTLTSAESTRTNTRIGQVEFKVEEFVPDTLRISANIEGLRTEGWNRLEDLSVRVTLQNLFGAPASGRRVAGNMTLSPTRFSFDKFKDHIFPDNIIEGTGMSRNAGPRSINESLEDATTDSRGHATLQPRATSPVSGTHNMSIRIEGFEGGGGRSVSKTLVGRVSNAEFLIGYKPSAELRFINRNSARRLNLIAVAPDLSKVAAENLTLRVIERRTVTSLIRNHTGQYRYQSVTQNRVLSTTNFSIPATGYDLTLDTGRHGDFHVEILDESGRIIMHAPYFVTGGANVSAATETSADLNVRLNKTTFAPGETIRLSITAPYAGTGLITIERDRVFTHAWFRASSTSSNQTITIPNDFEGHGYVNVSFVRDINSREIFATPHVFAVHPFKVENPARNIAIELNAPRLVTDGNLEINYSLSRPGSLMIFAINEGVLQVANYRTPNPLAHFFRKHALQVRTFQILDRLLPEFRILRQVAQIGGGEDGFVMESAMDRDLTNPFARRTDRTVAFYSGLIPNARRGSVNFNVPAGFNGELRIFAVASDGRAFGSRQISTISRSPVAITPSAPLMAAPNDEFEVSATIANMVENSGDKAEFAITVETTGGITASGAPRTIVIPENEERKISFRVKAERNLGNAEIKITAKTGDTTGVSRSTLSVRPATIFTTNLKAGADSGRFNVRDFRVDMFDEFRSRVLYISTSPFVFARPLFRFLEKYEFPCSEQIASRAMPHVLFAGNQFLGITQDAANKRVADTIAILRNRQNANGSFNAWEGQNRSDARQTWPTTYITHFLILARENGFAVPPDMLSNALRFLTAYVGFEMTGAYELTEKAYAIYVVTLGANVTTRAIEMFETFANEHDRNWERSLAGSYIAASYKLLKQDRRADALIARFNSDSFLDIARHAYLMREHFGRDARGAADAIRAYINRGAYGSFDAAKVIMALAPSSGDSLDNITVASGRDALTKTMLDGNIAAFEIPDSARRLDIDVGRRNVSWAVVEQGFPTQSVARSNGLNVYREFRDSDGNRITRASVGDEITVVIFAKTTGKAERVADVAIVDLLPAGFVVISDSVDRSAAEFIDVREDRVLIFRTVLRDFIKTTYRVKVTAKGRFTVPGIKAEAMYNPEIRHHGQSETFNVE